MTNKNKTSVPPVRTISTDDGGLAFIVSRAACKAMIAHASADETRAAFNSVLVAVRDGRAVLVATDGHRLAKIESGTRDEFHAAMGDAEALVPVAAMERAMKLARGKDGTVCLEFRPDSVVASETDVRGFPTANGASVTARTTDADFPPYSHVIGARRDENCADRPAPIIGFNPRYLGDVQHVADACYATGAAWEFPMNPLDPAYARIDGLTGDSAVVVVMPMRI